MKKTLALLMALCMILALAACGAKTEEPAPVAEEVEEVAEPVEEAVEEPAEEPAVEEAAEEPLTDATPKFVMTHADYVAAEVDTEVIIDTYIQARQGWWEKDGVGVASFYCQSIDGGYFLYNMPCSEDDYNNLLVPGNGIRVTGYKAEWSGEVEIIDASYETLSQTYEPEPIDVTEYLGTDELIDFQNEHVCFTGLTVEPANDEGAAFLYNWDGSGSEGSDLYFNVSFNGETYTFTVESYLCGPGTEVYEAVKSLEVGDVVNVEGFLYWYEGAQPHCIAVTK